MKSQYEDGEIVPGTPASAPTNPQLKKKTIFVTIIAIILWLLLVYIISSGLIRIQDISIFNRD
jgi:predicted secreted protein